MAQVPGCGCGTGGTGGGGTCASVVTTCVCADDLTSRPLLVRTVVLCDGTLTQSVVEMDGTPYVGPVKQCPDPDAVQGAPGGVQFCYEEVVSFSTTSDIFAEWFQVVPGLPTGQYAILLDSNYNVSNNSTQVGVEVRVDAIPQDAFQAGSLGSTDPDIRQPAGAFFCTALTDTSVISVQVNRAKGSGTASIYDGHIGIWAVA